MSPDLPERLHEHLVELLHQQPEMMSSKTPAGITRFWGASLGWPKWLLDGTSIAAPGSLTNWITLADDLRIITNLLDHLGEDRLLSMMLEWPRYPGLAAVLAMPDLKSAILAQSDAINSNNIHLSVSIESNKSAGLVSIFINPMLGPFLPIFEQVVLLLYFLMVRTFVGMASNGKSDLSEISIGQAHPGQTIKQLLPCKIREVTGRAWISIPAKLLSVRSPDFSAHHKTVPDTECQRNSVSAPRHKLPETESIADYIRTVLSESGRAPQLADIAHLHGLSERSLARVLVNSGTSFRKILEDSRKQLAQELLLFSDLPVQEVAKRLGYSESSAFLRFFSQQFLAPPARWRKQREAEILRRQGGTTSKELGQPGQQERK